MGLPLAFVRGRNPIANAIAYWDDLTPVAQSKHETAIDARRMARLGLDKVQPRYSRDAAEMWPRYSRRVRAGQLGHLGPCLKPALTRS